MRFKEFHKKGLALLLTGCIVFSSCFFVNARELESAPDSSVSSGAAIPFLEREEEDSIVTVPEPEKSTSAPEELSFEEVEQKSTATPEQNVPFPDNAETKAGISAVDSSEMISFKVNGIYYQQVSEDAVVVTGNASIYEIDSVDITDSVTYYNYRTGREETFQVLSIDCDLDLMGHFSLSIDGVDLNGSLLKNVKTLETLTIKNVNGVHLGPSGYLNGHYDNLRFLTLINTGLLQAECRFDSAKLESIVLKDLSFTPDSYFEILGEPFDMNFIRFEAEGIPILYEGLFSRVSPGFVSLANIDTIMTGIFNYSFRSVQSLELNHINIIKSRAFSELRDVQTLTLRNIGTIETDAFSAILGLVNLEMANVDFVEEDAFSHCVPQNLTLTQIGSFANPVFETDSWSIETININGFGVIQQGMFPYGKTTRSIILNNVAGVDDAALGGSNLTELELNQVGFLGTSVFQDSTALETLTIRQMESIGEDAFSGCAALTTLVIDHVGSIGNNAFSSCYNLANVTLNEVGSIPSTAFAITNIERLWVNGFDTITSNHFGTRRNLISLTLMNGNEIAENAFTDSNNIEEITIKGVDVIGPNAFSNGLYGPVIVVLEQIGAIYSDAFSGICLIESLEMRQIDTIHPNAFALGNSVEHFLLDGYNGTIEETFFGNVLFFNAQIKNVEGIGPYALRIGTSIELSDISFIDQNAIQTSYFVEKVSLTRVGRVEKNAFYKYLWNVRELVVDGTNPDFISFDVQFATIQNVEEINADTFSNYISYLTLRNINTIHSDSTVFFNGISLLFLEDIGTIEENALMSQIAVLSGEFGHIHTNAINANSSAVYLKGQFQQIDPQAFTGIDLILYVFTDSIIGQLQEAGYDPSQIQFADGPFPELPAI